MPPNTVPFARKADTAGPTQPPARGFPEDRLDMVLELCFPADMTHRKKEVDACLEVARHYALNPLLNEIRFVQSSSYEHGRKVWTVKPLVGRDGFIALAHRSGQYGGINTTVEFKPWPFFDRPNNQWQLYDQPVATCEVYRRDSTIPTIVTVGFWEYAAKEDGNIPEFWQRLGVTMTCKVAECQALRKAFDLAGLYSPEELSVGFIDAEGELQTPGKLHQEETIQDPPPEPVETPSTTPESTQQAESGKPAQQASPPQDPPQPPASASQTKTATLAQRLARARHILTTKYHFLDVTQKEQEMVEGRYEVDVDCFIVHHIDPKNAEILAWVSPSSPNSPVLDTYGFTEDTETQWWIHTLQEGE